MTAGKSTIEAIVGQLRRKHSDWTQFDHAHINRWKRHDVLRACGEAAAMLSRTELDRLLSAAMYDEFLERFYRISRVLLDHPAKSVGSGDFRMLESVDHKSAFCTGLLDLLYGKEEAPARLHRFVRYCEAMSLPTFWGFTTHCLFVTDTANNFLVKPRMMQCFLQLIGNPVSLARYPDAECYRQILALMARLKTEMSDYHPRDMIDIFCLVSTVYDIVSGNRRGVKK